MKHSSWLVLLTSCVVLCSCNLRKNENTSGSKSMTALEQEVEAEAKKIVETQFTQCGDSYNAEVTDGDTTSIVQCKTLSFTFDNYLSEADKLNGIEWKGQVSSKPVAERFYARNAWSDWKLPYMNSVCRLSFDAEKRNSVWTLKGSPYSYKYRKIGCSDVPK